VKQWGREEWKGVGEGVVGVLCVEGGRIEAEGGGE